MTYHKDGSPFQITKYKVVPNVLYYGWLSSAAAFEKSKDKQDYLIFRELADSINHLMTRGHHHCEFCGWTDADYGNGEMWLEVKNNTYIFPRMIWHYIQQHDYALPEEIYNSIKSGNYEITDEHKIEYLQSGNTIDAVNAPHLICRAM